MGHDLRKRVPRPLGLLLVCAALLSAAWAFFTPPWQGPDETMHYGYVESLAQRHARPGLEKGQLFSSQQRLSMRASNADKLISISNGRPQWSKAEADRYDDRAQDAPTGNGGGARKGSYNLARNNPPTFYVLELPAYAAGSVHGGVNARLYLMRLATILSLLATIVGVWLLVGELVGRNRSSQLAGAASVGLLPMATHLGSTVSPDSLMYAFWTFVLWLGVRALKRGFEPRVVTALVVTTVGAVLTKGTSVALVPPVLGVLAYGLWHSPRLRERVSDLRARKGHLLAVFVAGTAVAALMLVGGFARYSSQLSAQLQGEIAPKEMASYLWQFYLPRPGFLADFSTVKGIPVYDVWLKDLAGNFAWLQIQQPDWLYAVLGLTTVAVIVVGGITLWRDQPRSVVLFLAAVVGVLIAGLHLTDYQQGVKTGVGFMQGRYLLPVAGVFAGLVAASWSRLPAHRRPAATAIVLGALLALQVVSFSRAAGFWYV